MENSNSLVTIMKELFGDSLRDLPYKDISIDTVHNWDSLNHLRLMMAIEEEFNMQLSPDDFQTLTSFTEIKFFLDSN